MKLIFLKITFYLISLLNPTGKTHTVNPQPHPAPVVMPNDVHSDSDMG
jgi:hypothetical protein